MKFVHTFKALLIVIGLPLLLLALHFGNDFNDIESRGRSLGLWFFIFITILMPVLVRNYYKSGTRPASRGFLIGAVLGMTIITVPTSALLQTLAIQAHRNYETCLEDLGERYAPTCDRSQRIYGNIFPNAGLSNGLVVYSMLYTLTCVSVLKKKDK